MGTTNTPTAASDTPVQQAGGSGAASQPTNSPSVTDAIEAFMAVVTPAVNSLNNSLQVIAPADAAHHAKVGPDEQRVIPMVSAMLRSVPTLSGVSGDGLDAVMGDVAACTGLSRFLKGLTVSVDSTGRLRLEYGWQVASGAIGTARKQAPQSAVAAKDVTAINAVLAKGTKVAQAGHAAVSAQETATKAEARATKATAKAATATARANALQHGTGDATVAQPAPSAPAPSTTALAATPAEPGSTTIR